jgi:spore coat polysaccharide biosynthesis predicted glycosyltransferase SpsG
VVIGPAFRNQKEIARAAEGHGNISLYHNPDIKTLMDFADIAISAAGSTVYELAASGVPSILLVAADNQVLLASEAERRGIAINGGPASGLDSRLLAVLDELAGNMAKRQNMASTGQNIIDGRGAERVAGILLSVRGVK